MARYRFHCTNGSECVFDAEGAEIRVPARLGERAQKVARGIMRTFHDQSDWSGWRVAVCDLQGRAVLVQPFASGADAVGPIPTSSDIGSLTRKRNGASTVRKLSTPEP